MHCYKCTPNWLYSRFVPLPSSVWWQNYLKACKSAVPACSYCNFSREKPYFPCAFEHGSTQEWSASSLSVGARRSPQAYLWPPLPSCLTACQRVSKAPASRQRDGDWRSTRWLEVSEGNSANLCSLLCLCLCWMSAGKGVLLLSHWCFVDFFKTFYVFPPLQRAVLSLVASQDILTAPAVLSQLGHLLPQSCVFPLQKGGAHCDLVLLQPPRIPRTLRCQIVLLPPGPVLLILKKENERQQEVKQNSLAPDITDGGVLFRGTTFCSSGTNTFLAFLIIGCGFSSSSENLCLRGLNSSPPGTLDRTRSVGSGWKLMSTSMAFGSMGEGVLRSAESVVNYYYT